VIRIENISKTFNGDKVVDDVSASFGQGKVNLVIGASGTGKSVLIKCIIGLLEPDSGSAFFDEDNFTQGTERLRQKIRQKVGMLFQNLALFDSKNIEENIQFPLDILTNMTQKEKKKQVDFCLDKVSLSGVNKKIPSELSGGMRKRVALARAIVNQPAYLFCDEPNSGLDPSTAVRIDGLIREISSDDKITTIVVSHDMNSVVEIGENILFIHDGKKNWSGTAEGLIKSPSPELNKFICSSKLMRQLVSASSLP